jgi:hypothetical protein
MHKKIITACAALVALAAFVAPAVASASPVLTDSEGTVPAGAKLTATNTGNTVMTTALGKIECTKAELTADVHRNSSNIIEATITTASFTGTESENRCSGPIGAVKVTPKKLDWCMTAKAVPADTAILKSGACTTAGGAMEFTLTSALTGECTYTKAEVVATFATGVGGDLTVSEQEFTKSAGGGFCPGSGKLDMTFDLYTDGKAHEAKNQLFVS